MKCSGSAKHGYTIELGTAFKFDSVAPFRAAYESDGQEPCTKYRIDFNNTRFMDSSGLGMLINMKRYLSASDDEVSISLVNCSPHIKRTLIIACFDEAFLIE